MNKLLCLVGMTGSGKTEAAKFFQEKGYGYVRFGQVVLDECLKRDSVNEATEREVRNEFRHKLGMGAIAILNIARFDDALTRGNVLGDGLYSWDEYKILKEKYGNQFVCVAIIASPEIRYARLENRVFDPKKDKKAIYRAFTAQGAKERDYHELEELDKGAPIAMADYYVINEGTKSQFLKDLNTLYDRLLATS